MLMMNVKIDIMDVIDDMYVNGLINIFVGLVWGMCVIFLGVFYF